MIITAGTSALSSDIPVFFQGSHLSTDLSTLASRRLAIAPVAVIDRAQGPVLVATAPDWTSPLSIRRRAGAISRQAVAERLTAIAVHVPEDVEPDLDALVGGLSLGGYADDARIQRKTVRLSRIHIVHPRANRWGAHFSHAVATSAATIRARDWINAPAQDLGPGEMTSALRQLALQHGLDFTLRDAEECQRLELGCILGVGRASHRPPCLVELSIPGDGPLFALCGKGVCFDTGGLNLKPDKSMAHMRKDMAGAATVAAAMAAYRDRGGRRAVRAYLPLVENAIGPMAMRPGDILRAADGTTIEIGNTDAEGRLILADAMVRARLDGAQHIVTVATLTGAALVALGRIHVPLMSTNDGLAQRLENAALAAGERVWRLPLVEEHSAANRSAVADLKNDGDGEAGCITAGAFLAHFARHIPFAHLDISPASWAIKPHDLGPIGATGTMVATLVNLLES